MAEQLYWKPAGCLLCVPVGHIEPPSHNGTHGQLPSISLTSEGRQIFKASEVISPGIYHYFDPDTDQNIQLGYATDKPGVLFTKSGIDYSNSHFNKRPLTVVTWGEFLTNNRLAS